MSGKRLLDAIQFFNVAKSVATKHLAVRQHQLDVFTRTSSITKGVKSRADGVILTAQAAAALARRFNEPSAPNSAPKTDNPTTPQPPSPSRNAPDSFEMRSSSLSPDEAKKVQRQAEFQIPSSTATHSSSDGAQQLNVSQQQDVFYKPSQESTPELSSLSRMKMPHTTGNVQGGFGQDINADVFNSPLKSGETSSETHGAGNNEGLPDEMMKDIFHSPKVAKMLSSNKSASNKHSNWRTSRFTGRPIEQNTALEHTEDIKHAENKDMENLGSSIAETVDTPGPEVRK
ncbi:molecular chaperone ABC1 [Aspergillus sclerotialis]|uniref:Molecular chaperone ABC1 n=1 Tax=Aspergillus sclerotialis TaxID=2070753 RepID=A0A3A2ZGY4_9EURO|nr:molecular chaperone ABC1 [Aspergillus sclerotialis]